MPTLKLTVLPENLEYNFRLMQQTYPDAQTAAVVKANGYGLGIENVVPPFVNAGCKTFFVNRFSEGKAVQTGRQPDIAGASGYQQCKGKKGQNQKDEQTP